jgi:hypothetical protein
MDKNIFNYQVLIVLIAVLIHSCLVSISFPILFDSVKLFFILMEGLNSQVGWIILIGFPIIIIAVTLMLGSFFLPSFGVGLFSYLIKKLSPEGSNKTIDIPEYAIALIIFAGGLFIDEKLWINTDFGTATVNTLLAASCIITTFVIRSTHKSKSRS